MVKKFLLSLFKKFWSKEFLRYFIIGISAFALDLLSLFFFKEHLRFSPVFSVIVNQIFIINYVFFLNKYWSFKSGALVGKEAVRFLTVAVGNYLISIVWMAVFNHYLGFNYLLVRLINVVLAVSWNFLFYKHYVYV